MNVTKILACAFCGLAISQYSFAENGFLSGTQDSGRILELTSADFDAARARLAASGAVGKEAEENRLMIDVLERNSGPYVPIPFANENVLWTVVTSVALNGRRLVVAGDNSYLLTPATQYLMTNGSPASADMLVVDQSVGVISAQGRRQQQVATKVVFSAD